MTDLEPRPRTAAQALDGWLERMKKRVEYCHIEDNAIVFRIDITDDQSTTYEVPLFKCDTHEKIIGWQCHLSEKNWMTLDLLIQFTLLACRHHGLAISS